MPAPAGHRKHGRRHPGACIPSVPARPVAWVAWILTGGAPELPPGFPGGLVRAARRLRDVQVIYRWQPDHLLEPGQE